MRFFSILILFPWQLIWTECLVKKVKCLGFEEEHVRVVLRCPQVSLCAHQASCSLALHFNSHIWDEDVNAAAQSSAFILWSALKKSVSVPFHLWRAYLRMRDPPPPCFFSQGHMSSRCLAGWLPGGGGGGRGGGGAEPIHQVHYITMDQSAALCHEVFNCFCFFKLYLLLNLFISGLFQGF